MWYVVGGLFGLFVAFIVWRLASVSRGARQRDERLLARLDPIGHKIDAGETVTAEEVRALAEAPEMRYLLFHGLRAMEKAELLPTDFSSPIQQAEAALVYWMLHPNELQDPPENIDHVKEVIHPIPGNETAVFHVFRYHMPAEHWAGKDGWLLGVVGPMEEDLEPYERMPGAFSRCNDKVGDITPEELVAWYADMMTQKGAYA